MGSLSSWAPYSKHVQGGLREADFVNGQFIMVAAGPPHMANFGGPGQLNQNVVYPIGVTQNLAMSQNRVVTRIFEIGSERSYFIPGRTVGQVTLSRIWYHGPSLLRVLWAYYTDESASKFPAIKSLFDAQFGGLDFPYLAGTSGDVPGDTGSLHDVQIPPGYENFFINLGSDLFQNPIGLLLMVRDSSEQPIGAVYLEQCYVPTHSWAVDSQGLIVQESVGIQYERAVPINIRSVSLLRGLIEGNMPAPQFQPVAA